MDDLNVLDKLETLIMGQLKSASDMGEKGQIVSRENAESISVLLTAYFTIVSHRAYCSRCGIAK